jgi:hypothetical protein
MISNRATTLFEQNPMAVLLQLASSTADLPGDRTERRPARWVLGLMLQMPKDPERFDKYYREVHGPMTGKLPGVKGYKYGRVCALGLILRDYDPRDRMSALGQKQTSDCRPPMSALPRKRTLVERNGMSALCHFET